MHGGMLAVNGPAPIENLEIIFSCIMQLDDIPFWSVENGIESVTLIEISGADSVSFLASDCFVQRRVRRTDKQSIQRSCGIRFQRELEIRPRELIVTNYAALGQHLDVTWSNFGDIESHLR